MRMASVPIMFNQCESFRLPRDSLNETDNPFTAVIDIIRGISITFKCYKHVNAKTTANKQGIASLVMSDFLKDVQYFLTFNLLDVAVVLGLAILWTIFRIKLVKQIFEPFARNVGVLDHNIRKFGESAWKSVAYGFMWLSAIYVTFFRGYNYFQKPLQMWATHDEAWDLCFLYALETSWYFHSIYTTICVDIWRKDSVVMLTHHLVALTLIISSYAVGFLKVGVIIFVLDDIGDVILESGKCATYMRHRRNGFSPFFDVISNIGAVLFAIQWIFLRLQMHLTKVVRSAAIGVWITATRLPIPCHLYFDTFLITLYFFYCYWFFFIVMFVIRVLVGKGGSAEDPREDEDKVIKTKPGDNKAD